MKEDLGSERPCNFDCAVITVHINDDDFVNPRHDRSQCTRYVPLFIHTLNEERNIASALRSVVSWVDEIIVVDMYSDDSTVEIARAFGAKIFLHEKTGFVEPARNFAQEKATGDWIIALDADEIIPPELSRELMKIAEDNRADICYVPRLNYFGGFPLLHSGWGPEQD